MSDFSNVGRWVVTSCGKLLLVVNDEGVGMNNPIDSPNFWLLVVFLLTGFALITYSGPQVGLTGAATGSSKYETHQPQLLEDLEDSEDRGGRQLMEFYETDVEPIYGSFKEKPTR